MFFLAQQLKETPAGQGEFEQHLVARRGRASAEHADGEPAVELFPAEHHDRLVNADHRLGQTDHGRIGHGHHLDDDARVALGNLGDVGQLGILAQLVEHLDDDQLGLPDFLGLLLLIRLGGE